MSADSQHRPSELCTRGLGKLRAHLYQGLVSEGSRPCLVLNLTFHLPADPVLVRVKIGTKRRLALCHRQQRWFISLCFLILKIFFFHLTPFDFHGNSQEKLCLNFARWALRAMKLTHEEKMRWHCWEAERWDLKLRACDFCLCFLPPSSVPGTSI